MFEVTKTGALVRTIDTSAGNATNQAGIVLAPASNGSTAEPDDEVIMEDEEAAVAGVAGKPLDLDVLSIEELEERIAALHSYDGVRRFTLPMTDAPAAAASVPKGRRPG